MTCPCCWRCWHPPARWRSRPPTRLFLGELALDGSLRPVSGVLPMALVYPARTAREVVDALRALCHSPPRAHPL